MLTSNQNNIETEYPTHIWVTALFPGHLLTEHDIMAARWINLLNNQCLKERKIFIQWISLQMQWTGLWFDFPSSSSVLTGISSQVGNLSQQSELLLNGYRYQSSVEQHKLLLIYMFIYSFTRYTLLCLSIFSVYVNVSCD